MNRKLFLVIVPFVLAAFTHLAMAEIYKYVDADGRVTYSNVKLKGSQRLDIEPADSNFGTMERTPAGKRPETSRSPTPSNFPKVDSTTQNQRDVKRKDVLRAELESERQALERAKQAYAEGEANPEISRGPNGKTFRNMPKFQEKMSNLQAAVDVHQRNIELLTRELNQ